MFLAYELAAKKPGDQRIEGAVNMAGMALLMAFMVFVLLYMPCVAAFSAIRREMNSWKWAVGTVTFQTVVAWVVSFMVYQFGTLAVNLAGLL